MTNNNKTLLQKLTTTNKSFFNILSLSLVLAAPAYANNLKHGSTKPESTSLIKANFQNENLDNQSFNDSLYFEQDALQVLILIE